MKLPQNKKSLPNLFADIPQKLGHEWVEELQKTEHIRIERIVARGQSSPANFWYDQEEDEWVAVLAGKAILEIKGQSKMVLSAGDALLLPAHTEHRVEWTDPQHDTIWLAVFWKPSFT